MKIAKTHTLETISSALKKYIELIAPTYGPAGKKVLIAHSEFNIKAVDDGFEASKEFELEDEFENAVIQYIRESTAKTNEKAGDGTTTAGLLTSAIFKETLGDQDSPLVSLKKNYHTEVKDIEKGIKEAVKYIKDKSKKVKTKQELYNIAYNSYNNEEIATLISDTLLKIGETGLLAIGDSQTAQTEVEMVEGLEIEKGFKSPYFINTEKEEAVLINPTVLTIDGRLDSFKDILPLLQQISQTNKNVCIIAEGYSDEVLNNIILTRIKGNLAPLLLETPGFGDNKRESLENIAVVTGATVVDQKIQEWDKITLAEMGNAKRIISTKDKTIIIGGAGDKSVIKARITRLTEKMEEIKDNYQKETLRRHIASLSGGMALIKVGANTENEQKSVKAKVEDSVNATKLAFKDGIVKGGGKTYADIKTSSDILNRALKYPLTQLQENGAEYLDDNVIDPAGVLVVALETAGSIACGLLEMGGIITTKREEKNKVEY